MARNNKLAEGCIVRIEFSIFLSIYFALIYKANLGLFSIAIENGYNSLLESIHCLQTQKMLEYLQWQLSGIIECKHISIDWIVLSVFR